MTKHASDTDPSSPLGPATTEPGVAPPALGTAGTDPMGGPADPRRSRVTTNRGINVPAPTPQRAARSGDSVDELLDNFADAPAPKVKMTPQSAGQSAATFAASYTPRAAQVTAPPEPKVVVHRTTNQPTMRIDRSTISSLPPPDMPRPVVRDQTVVAPPARKPGKTVIVALFSAVLVVFLIFMGFRRWAMNEKQQAAQANPSLSALVNGGPPVASVLSSARAVADPATTIAAPTEPVASAEPIAAPTARPIANVPKLAPTAPTPKASAKPSVTAAPVPTDKIDRDYRLGE